jgi:hypothetical protein
MRTRMSLQEDKKRRTTENKTTDAKLRRTSVEILVKDSPLKLKNHYYTLYIILLLLKRGIYYILCPMRQ